MEERPEAMVLRLIRGRRRRKGRGFSVDEIQRAGLTLHKARMLSVSIDRRRRTSHPWNVQRLRSLHLVVPLTEIRGIGEATSTELMEASVSDAHDLARCDVEKLSEKVRHSAKTLRKWQMEAKRLIKERATHTPS